MIKYTKSPMLRKHKTHQETGGSFFGEILNILKMNKFESDFAGPYPYSDEEKAQMIINLYGEKSKDSRKRE